MKLTTEDANLEGAVYTNVNLGGARFTNVNLGVAQFTDVNMAGARFEDVSLIDATVENVNCTNFSIRHARYEGMRIDGILVTELLRVYRDSHPADLNPSPDPPCEH